MPSNSRRKIGVLLVAAVLMAPWAAAAEPGARTAQRSSGAAWVSLSQLWDAMAAFWGGSGNAAPEPTEHVDEGCKIDPFGVCRDRSILPPPTESVEEGCKIDPYGGCSS